MSQPLILLARVLSTKDPDKLGRVQVEFVAADDKGSKLKFPWLRMVHPAASKKHGFFFLPDVGDDVVVLRGSGNAADGMMILGCVYTGTNKPTTPDADGKNDLAEIRTRSGAKLSFLDKSGKESITLSTGDSKVSILLDKAGGKIVIDGLKMVHISTKQKAVVEATEVSITGKSKVTVEGSGGVTIKSSAKIDILGGMVKISGPKIDIG